MLRLLRIRNLAVIEAVEIEFGPGFNVLTGETGAGKSILVGAVGLLLGGRASADLIRTGEATATIEALFETGAEQVRLTREISSQGRSRSLVNGAPATAATLRDWSARLVELHGQHEHQALLDPRTHLPLLDGYAHASDLVQKVAAAWSSVRRLRDELEGARMDGREREVRRELVAFQLAEIQKAAPHPDEDEQLASLRQVLASAERVRRLCDESYALLYDGDGAVLSALSGVWKRVGELATMDPQFLPYVEARDGIKSELEDLSLFVRTYAERVDASPARLQQTEDRLAVLERLKRKYGPSLQDVIDTGDALAREHATLTGTASSAELEAALESATQQYLGVARDLSSRRRGAAPRLAEAVEGLLASLAMTEARFEVRLVAAAREADWSERGIDDAEFYISPNRGEDLRPLSRTASGGELSRVMLALKTLAAGAPDGKTLIFDEVDVGIGGRVADVVGAKLQALGAGFQVLCITHLPQIAARAATHFRIDKAVRAGRTLTSVDRVEGQARVEELARMLGGAAVTDASRASARELLSLGVPPRPRGGAKAKGESERSRHV